MNCWAGEEDLKTLGKKKVSNFFYEGEPASVGSHSFTYDD
jgi:hypothetical protein